MEHLFSKFLVILFLFLGLTNASCQKIDKQPELSDKIYLDLIQERDNAKKEVEGLEKELEIKKGGLEKVVPQTGQIKRARDKFFMTEQQLEKAKQKYLYFQTKIESRTLYVRKRYVESYNQGKKLDLSSEEQDYFSNKSTSYDLNWSAKKRVEGQKK